MRVHRFTYLPRFRYLWAVAGAGVILAAGACGPTPPPGPPPPPFVVTGASTGSAAKYKYLDATMRSFMQQYGIPAGQLAIADAGQVLFSHAYTNTAYTTYITEPTFIMRVASNSKALVCAAITELYAMHVLSPDIHVYSFLGVHAPLLPNQPGDPRAEAITIRELVAHTAGLSGADDTLSPEFNMWSIEVAAGNTGPLTDAQFTAYPSTASV